MRLISFSAKDYRRFVAPTSVKLHADMVALVGPNESGKSSILRALSRLGDDNPFDRGDQHRRTGRTPQLAWTFQLEDDDRDAISDIPEARSLTRVTIRKGESGSREWEISINRNLEPREKLRRQLSSFMGTITEDGNSDVVLSHEAIAQIESTLEILGAREETLSAPQIDILVIGQAALDTMTEAEELEGVSESDNEVPLSLLTERDQLSTAIEALVSFERQPEPSVSVKNALLPRLPTMIMYTQQDRDLNSSYDLNEVADNTPRALMHLAALARLDLAALRDEVVSGLRADVATRRDAANRALRSAFDQSWNQQKVALQIDLDGSTLFIHALSLTREDAGLSNLAERSDGMRWFASLLAFVHGWGGSPILLVDEIETHLHYDAQADLVNVLSRQDFTSKVIYTTHSFGCLPADIGTGLRVVVPLDETTSKLENGFWRNGAGFSPLMASMGAGAVSFTPSRHVVIAEGPSDAILLPTLFRQATECARVPFQVAPGLSEVATAKAKGLMSEAGQVAFLVDGDSGGLSNRDKLVAGGVSNDQVTVLTANLEAKEALETEDLVSMVVYVKAVNDELACWQTVPRSLQAEDVGPSLRTKQVAAWCQQQGLESPDKVAVAERIIDVASDVPIFSMARMNTITRLFDHLKNVLGLSNSK